MLRYHLTAAKRLTEMAADGRRRRRLILGPTHHVQLDTPMENIWAMVRTITETSYET